MAYRPIGINKANQWPHTAQMLLVFAACSFVGWLEFAVSLNASGLPLFWLPSGIALAVVYRYGASLLPAIIAAAALVTYQQGLPLLNSLAVGAGNGLAAYTCVWLIRRYRCDLTRLTPADTGKFLLLSTLGMLPSTIIGNISYGLNDDTLFSPNNWLRWWAGDSLGCYLLAPLLINLNLSELRKPLTQIRQLLLITCASLLVMLLTIALQPYGDGRHIPLLFASFLCLLWASLNLGLVYSNLLALLFCLCLLITTNLDANSSAQLGTWMIWTYSTSMALLGLTINATQRQLNNSWNKLKQRSQEQAHQKTRLNAILQALPDLMLETNRQGLCLSSAGNLQPLPQALEHPRGVNLSHLLPEPIWATWQQALREADEQGLSRSKNLRFEQQMHTQWLELVIAKNPGETPEEDTFVCLARDITLRKQVHDSDLANAQRFRQIFETTSNIAVQGYNREHQVIFWNRASEDLYGFKADDAHGRYLEDLIIPSFMRSEVFNAIENWHIQDVPIPSGELPLQDSHGEQVWVYSNHVMIDTPHGREMYCLDIDLRPQRQATVRLEQELSERRIAEDALRASERQLESAQTMARLAYWEWFPDNDNYRFSRAMAALFNLGEAQLQGELHSFLQTCMEPRDQQHFLQQLNQCLAEQSPFTSELHWQLHDQDYWLEIQGNLEFDLHARPRLCGSLQDISERKRLDKALAAAAADTAADTDFYATLLRALNEALGTEHSLISLLDPDNLGQAHSHTYIANNATQENFSYQLQGTPCSNVIDENFCFVTSHAIARYPDDAMFHQLGIDSYLGVGLRNAQGRPMGILMVMSTKPLTVSAQVRSLMMIFSERISGELNRANIQEQIYQLAFFDPLTRLPNRRMLMDRLRLILGQSARTGQQGALLFIDLDHFKLLNDTRGHHIGDQLLSQVAERISSIIRTTDLAARLGGDEFVVVFDNLGTDPEQAAREAKARAEELHALVKLPYSLQHTVYHCTISIGVNLFTGRSHSIDDLLRHADVAMYQAKDSGRNAIRFFDPLMQSHLERRAEIETDLRSAHEASDQLVPYYQAQVNSAGKVVGAELLLRWLHPEKGLISPADFIPVAEQTGLILAIGRQVLHFACQQLECWQQQPALAHLSLAVNVSPIQFNQANFADELIALVSRYGFPHEQLKLELTESSLLKNVEQSIEKMLRLRKFGIGFSMDDFGIGYSSLSYLKKLPLDLLKIDQSFVRDIAIDPNDAVIVRTIIAMAKSMNLDVIAEGVETEAQRQFLERNGCNMFQGYYFARPLPLAIFEEQFARIEDAQTQPSH